MCQRVFAASGFAQNSDHFTAPDVQPDIYERAYVVATREGAKVYGLLVRTSVKPLRKDGSSSRVAQALKKGWKLPESWDCVGGLNVLRGQRFVCTPISATA